MTDRVIVYTTELPRSVDFLQAENNVLYAISGLLQAAFGSSTFVDGLACTVGTGISVNIGPGTIGQLQTMDVNSVALGSLPLDTTTLMKLGLNSGSTNFALVAPTTPGYAINYLIEAQLLEVDNLPVVLPYYNAANPAVPFAGPAGAGSTQNTRRQQTVSLQLKAGGAATIGTQATPGADGGWVPLWIITVPYGASAVLSSNIYVAPGAPFIGSKIEQSLIKLTSNLTLHVSTTGNDTTNNGTSTNTAFATIQAAFNALSNYNLNGFGVNISCSPGSYANATLTGLPTGYGNGSFVNVISGTGSGVTITGSGANAALTAAAGAYLGVGNGVTLTGTIGLQCYQNSNLAVQAGVTFGACTVSQITANGGNVVLDGAYTIAGNAPVHMQAVNQGTITYGANSPFTVTLTGTPAFSVAFAQANNGRIAITSSEVTYSGSATGSRYIAQMNGVIDTLASGASFFPGNAAGTNPTGGQYN